MSGAGGRVTAIFASLTTAAVLAAFADFLSADRIPAYRDLLVLVVPAKHFLASHLWRGELPLWNPWIYMGTPFLASLQNGVCYPLSVFFFLPFPLAFNCFLLAHFAVAAGGFWLLSRTRGLAPAACAVGSLTFVLGGYLVSMVNLTNQLQAAVWSPWILMFWIRYRNRRQPRDLVAFTLVVTVCMLAGAPEVALMILAALALWTLLEARDPLPARVGLEATLASAVVLALALAAFQLVPTIEYIGESARVGRLPFAEVATWSLQPVSLLQWLLPNSVTPGAETDAARRIIETGGSLIRSIYLGLVPLCLVVPAVAGGTEKRFWVALAAGSLLLALGPATPVFPWLYEALPFFVGKFRYPEKFYLLVHFAVAVLASEGAALCLRDQGRSQGLARAAAVTLLAVVAAIYALRWLSPASYLTLVANLSGELARMTDYVPLAEDLAAKALRGILLLGCFLAVLGLRRASLLSTSTFGTLMVALVAVDLASIAHGLNRTISWRALEAERVVMSVDDLRAAHQRMFLYQTVSAPFAGEVPQPIPGLEQRLQFSLRAPRFEDAARAVWRTMLFDIPMIAEVGTLSGGDGIVRSSDNELRAVLATTSRDGAVKLLRTFGVAELAGATLLEVAGLSFERSVDEPRAFVYRVRDPIPPVYLASRLSQATTPRDAFRRILEDDFVPGLDAVVEEPLPEWADRPAGDWRGEARMTDWAERRIEVATRASGPALLVVNDSYFPGWSAAVDGRPAEIVRANFLARGVVLAAGEHRIELIYRPRSLFIGAAISLGAFAILAAAVTVSAWRRPAAAARSRTP